MVGINPENMFDGSGGFKCAQFLFCGCGGMRTCRAFLNGSIYGTGEQPLLFFWFYSLALNRE